MDYRSSAADATASSAFGSNSTTYRRRSYLSSGVSQYESKIPRRRNNYSNISTTAAAAAPSSKFTGEYKYGGRKITREAAAAPTNNGGGSIYGTESRKSSSTYDEDDTPSTKALSRLKNSGFPSSNGSLSLLYNRRKSSHTAAQKDPLYDFESIIKSVKQPEPNFMRKRPSRQDKKQQPTKATGISKRLYPGPSGETGKKSTALSSGRRKEAIVTKRTNVVETDENNPRVASRESNTDSVYSNDSMKKYEYDPLSSYRQRELDQAEIKEADRKTRLLKTKRRLSKLHGDSRRSSIKNTGNGSSVLPKSTSLNTGMNLLSADSLSEYSSKYLSQDQMRHKSSKDLTTTSMDDDTDLEQQHGGKSGRKHATTTTHHSGLSSTFGSNGAAVVGSSTLDEMRSERGHIRSVSSASNTRQRTSPSRSRISSKKNESVLHSSYTETETDTETTSTQKQSFIQPTRVDEITTPPSEKGYHHSNVSTVADNTPPRANRHSRTFSNSSSGYKYNLSSVNEAGGGSIAAPTISESPVRSHRRRQSSSGGGNKLRASLSTLSVEDPLDFNMPTPMKGGRYRGIVGLRNLGNTCFMNSCLQCLCSAPPLIEYFQSRDYVKDLNRTSRTRGSLAKAFANLVLEIGDSASNSVLIPSEVKRTVAMIAPRFSGYGQQDIQEFLQFLLDGLHDDLNRVIHKPAYEEIKDKDGETDEHKSNRWWRNYCARNQSFISDLFCGQLSSSVVCQTCGHKSQAFDPFWSLSVPIPKSGRSSRVFGSAKCSLEDCFDEFTKEELLTGNDQFYCSRCKTHRDVVKNMKIFRFPYILVVHIKRFSSSMSHSMFSRKKLTTTIKFPIHGLDLTGFSPKRRSSSSKAVYNLFAVSNHTGSLGGGHYTAYGKVGTDSWYNFNDSHCSRVSESKLVSNQAYVLFYMRDV